MAVVNVIKFNKKYTLYDIMDLHLEYAKRRALDLIDKARKATTYQYQEYAGANYSTFEHDIDILKQVALITIEQMISILPKNEYMEDSGKLIKNREIVFWELFKTELEALK